MTANSLSLDLAVVSQLRVGIKWDPIERDALAEEHKLDDDSARRHHLKASLGSSCLGFIAGVLRATHFLRSLAAPLERWQKNFLEDHSIVARYLEQQDLPSCDLDLWCLCYDGDGKLVEYVAPSCRSHKVTSLGEQAIIHSGDDPTGTGEQFDEELLINPRRLAPNVRHIFFVVLSLNYAFNAVKGGSCTVLNTRDEKPLLFTPMHGSEHQLCVAARLDCAPAWKLQEVAAYHPFKRDNDTPLNERIDALLQSHMPASSESRAAAQA